MIRMNAERIFHEARSLPPPEQAAYLRGACGDDVSLRSKVEGLLKADLDAGTFMDSVSPEANPGPPDPNGVATIDIGTREHPGQTIGRYKLLEQIGEGGFGSVWMAEQREPVKRRVALKIIKLGMDTRQVIARFEAERQALAMMDHPNIAKVFDAGSTERGRPFFVMEYIRGVPIVEYCDTEKLDTTARLHLFMSVCHAIQHAHQKGIIHRDIKPGNVLITMHDGVPVPKVIDFGIAKATNQELTEKTLFTQHRQMIGTPAYMSPEQLEMSGLDIDTRSDIYSLGVLLYELLTGTTPFDTAELVSKGFAEMIRMVRETEPERPSTRLNTLRRTATSVAPRRSDADFQKLGSILRGDLDWITMKCLEKDRTRRYETANGLAADIQRHLNDDPVVAGPPTARYRLQKFIKRNRGMVAAIVAIAAVLIIGVVGTSIGMVSALRAREAEAAQRRVAEERFAAAQRYVKTIADEVYPGIQSLIGATQPLEAMTRATSDFLEDLAVDKSDSPALRFLTVRMLIRQATAQGDAFAANTVGDFNKSLETALHARKLLATLPEDLPDVAAHFTAHVEIEDRIAVSQRITGDFNAALQTYLALEAYCKELAKTHASDPGNSETPDSIQSAIDLRLRLLDLRIGHVYGELGDYDSQLRRYQAQAQPFIARGIDVKTASLEEVHMLSVSHGLLADALENLGRDDEALEHWKKALEVDRVKARRWPNNARAARDVVQDTAKCAWMSAKVGKTDDLDKLVDEAVHAGQALVARDSSNGGFLWQYASALLSSAEAYRMASEVRSGQRRIDLLKKAVKLWSLALDDPRLVEISQVKGSRVFGSVTKARDAMTKARTELKQLEAAAGTSGT